jgi:hypothetical protein
MAMMTTSKRKFWAIVGVAIMCGAGNALAGQPIEPNAVATSDGVWQYAFSRANEAARFGGNFPPDYIKLNICDPQNVETNIDNGAGDRLETTVVFADQKDK